MEAAAHNYDYGVRLSCGKKDSEALVVDVVGIMRAGPISLARLSKVGWRGYPGHEPHVHKDLVIVRTKRAGYGILIVVFRDSELWS